MDKSEECGLWLQHKRSLCLDESKDGGILRKIWGGGGCSEQVKEGWIILYLLVDKVKTVLQRFSIK